MAQEQKKLADSFNDDSLTEHDFFGVLGGKKETTIKEEEEVKTEEIKVEEEKEYISFSDTNEEEKSDVKPKKEEATEKKAVLKDREEELEEDKKSSVNEDDEDDKIFYTNLYKTLKEKKILTSVEVDDDVEIDEDKFIEIQEQELEARLEEAIDELEEKLDRDARDFMEFKKNGGNTQNFLKVYSQVTFPEDMDLTIEKNKDKVLKHALKVIENLDDEDLEERLEFINENQNRKDKFTKKYHTAIVEKVKTEKEELLENQQKAREKAKLADDKFKLQIKEKLEKNEEILGFSITKNDKSKIFNNLTKADIKEGKQFRTKFQVDLSNALKDNDQLIALAKILDSGFKFTDFIKKGAETKVQKIREKLDTSKNSHKEGRNTSTINTNARTSLADRF